MRIFLFKIFYKLAALVLPNKDRSVLVKKYCEDQITLHAKDKQLAACVRPRSYPTVKGHCLHTDYYD